MMRGYCLALFSAFLAFLSTCVAEKESTTPVTVKCSAGTIIGQTSKLSPTVHEFLGIPFAEPPTGDLRFEPSVRKAPASKPISASKFGLSCPSFWDLDVSKLGLPFNLTAPEGEDCLTLNIWARPSMKNVPVLVWIYGGGFYIGTADIPLFDGTYLAGHNDVVIVSFNYRTNVFGFPNSPAVKSENLGILDQRLAVEWVRDNIAAFGGDPKKITIFGQSAGGGSVDIWSYAWAKDPIVNGFIEQSGAAPFLTKSLGGGTTYNAWNNLTVTTGCASGTEEQQLACMKRLNWKTIKSALKTVFHRPGQCTQMLGSPLGPDFFGPRIDGKLIFSYDEYYRKGKAGEFAKLPLITGTTDTELIIKKVTIEENPSCIGVNPAFGIPNIDISPAVYSQLISAIAFVCPSRDQAQFRATHNVPVWRYRYFASFNYTIPSFNALGAVHLSELPVLFGLAAELAHLPAREQHVMKEFQSAWVTFANDPEKGLSSAPFKWNEFSLDDRAKRLIRIAYEKEEKASMSTTLLYDYWCDVFDTLGGSGTNKRRRAARRLERSLPNGVTQDDVEKVKRITPDQFETLKRWAHSQAKQPQKL